MDAFAVNRPQNHGVVISGWLGTKIEKDLKNPPISALSSITVAHAADR
jgi:hypothetical protein